MLFLVCLVNPDLRVRRAQRDFAQCRHGVLVEYARRDAGPVQQVSNEVGLGQIQRGIDSFHAASSHGKQK